jgi:hypothetical protein
MEDTSHPPNSGHPADTSETAEPSLWTDNLETSRSPAGGAPEQDPIRVCPKCSTQSQTAGEYCPHCGARYVRGRKGLSRRAKRVLLAALLLAVLGGAAGGYAVKHHHDQQVAVRHRREQAAAREVARQRALAEAAARAAAEARRAKRQFERSVRHSVVASLRASITKDARKDVSDGVLTGPILRTACTPVGGGNVDNLAAHTGNFSCLAVYKDNADGTSSGWSFAATVNYDDGTYTWHLGQ